MDHVSCDKEKIQSQFNNSSLATCHQSQATQNESSESMRLFLEESQGESQINDHNNFDEEESNNKLSIAYTNGNKSPLETSSKVDDDNSVHNDFAMEATNSLFEASEISENGPIDNKNQKDECNVENKSEISHNKLNNIMSNDDNLTCTTVDYKDVLESTDSHLKTPVDTSVSHNLSSCPVATDFLQSDVQSLSSIKMTQVVDRDIQSSSCSNECQLKLNVSNNELDDHAENSNRKRKIEDEILENIKIKKTSDYLDKNISGQTFSAESHETDSSNISLNIPETSLDISTTKTLINGDSSALLDTSDICLSSANLSVPKDESDLGNYSGNETPELQKRDSLFLNNSEGLNIDGNSSPDQGPTFELISRLDESNDIVSLIINRTDRKYLDYNADWSQNSSPGSVTSTGVFQLNEHKRISTMSSSTTSSAYSTKTNDNFVIPAIPLKKTDIHKQGIKGHKELFKFIKDIFKTACNDLSFEDSDLSHEKLNVENQEKKTNFEQVNNRTSTNDILNNHFELINSPEIITNDATNPALDTASSNTNLPGTPRACQIKNTSRIRPASPRLNSTSHLDITSDQDFRLTFRVLARWVDKKYYAGRIIDTKDNNKFTIRFDDDHTKTLLQDYIIFGEQNTLPLHGQSVYVLLNNEEGYIPGIVTSITEEADEVRYLVQTDSGESSTVKASDIYLTEDQAKAIKEINSNPSTTNDTTHTPKKSNCQDLSLDNIIHGPRSRRQVVKALTPTAGSSGLSKLRRTTSRGSKQRHFSESSDRSITEPPSPASTTEFDEASSAKGPIEEVHGVEPEIQKTPKKITGVLTGPFPVKGCGRLSGRRTSKVTGCLYDNSDPETVQLLGPIPTSNKLFFKKCFLLTCTEVVSHKTKLDRLTTTELSGTDSEYSTDAENCSVPFMKERLKCQLEAGGGIVYSHFEEIPQSKYRNCTLIAPRACHTAKYIQCLATNIKAVLHTWVIDCCKSDKLLSKYDLPAGWSIERKCYVRFQIGKELYMRLSSNPFNDFLILLCSDNANFLKFWGRVCKSAGASIKIIENEDVDISVGSVIVTDSDCPLKVRKQAQNLDIPLVSTTWVVQSLIVGQVCNYDNSIKYAHNYVDTD